MGSIIIRAARDSDLYVEWSSVVEAPTAWGDRDFMLRHLGPNATARLDRADQRGSSCLDMTEGYWGDDEGFIYQQQGFLPRASLTALVDRLEGDDNADVSDLLVPFEDDDDV